MRSESLWNRLLALVVRPTARPLGWGIVVAVTLIGAEVLVVEQLKRVAPDNAFGAVFLFGVLIVSAGWGFGLAVATSFASALVYAYIHLEGNDSLAPALFVFLTLALLVNLVAGQARLRTAEAEQRRREASALALQQTALRRVATLVARGADPVDVYPVAVAALAHAVDAEHVTLLRYESDGAGTVVASHERRGVQYFPIGERVSLDGDSVTGLILRTAEPARVDDYADVDGAIAVRLHDLGLRSGVGVPILVDDEVRGALIIGSTSPTRLPDETEAHISDFADLVATAIHNSETRTELTASRARIVAAADQARRGFERDLHDGAQQRIVSLGLELRAVQASIPAEQTELRDDLGKAVDGLGGLYTDLQELSRGLHPAILSKGGLGPALKTLARRSAVPVRLEVDLAGRLPESVEVAAYYVVAEALTNATKHAQATEVSVLVEATDGDLLLSISDDGIGGASAGGSAGGGSGLIGLKDRVEAVSGKLRVSSPPGGGTTLTATIPT